MIFELEYATSARRRNDARPAARIGRRLVEPTRTRCWIRLIWPLFDYFSFYELKRQEIYNFIQHHLNRFAASRIRFRERITIAELSGECVSEEKNRKSKTIKP